MLDNTCDGALVWDYQQICPPIENMCHLYFYFVSMVSKSMYLALNIILSSDFHFTFSFFISPRLLFLSSQHIHSLCGLQDAQIFVCLIQHCIPRTTACTQEVLNIFSKANEWVDEWILFLQITNFVLTFIKKQHAVRIKKS